MANFFNLLKVQFLSFLGLNKILHSKNKRKLSGINGLLIMALLIVALIGFYAYTYADAFALMLSSSGELPSLIPIMLGISAMVSFMFSFYAVGSLLFGFKDYDMLASMPIKSSTIIFSKLTFMYLSDLAFSLLFIIPSLVVYFGYTGVVVLSEIILSLAMAIFSPLLPLAISIIIGLIVNFISSRFRKANIARIISLMVVFVGVVGLSFITGFTTGDEVEIPQMDITGIIGKIYFIFPIAQKAFVDVLWCLLFLGINLISAVVVVAFVCVFYKKLNAVFSTKRTLRKFRLKEYSSNSVRKTLLAKEIKRLFSCPIYAVNTLLGAVLGVVASVGFAVVVNSMSKSNPTLVEMLKSFIVLIPAVFAFMFLISPTTACSLSLEGSAFWVIKTAPVSAKQIFNAKLSLNVLFFTLPAFISSVIIAVFTGCYWLDGILLVVIAVLISLFGGCLGLLLNLLFPKLKWENENVPVKQSMPVFVCVMSTILLSGILAITAIYLPLPPTVLLSIFAGLFVILTVVGYALIYKYGEKLFNKMN